MNIYAYRIIQNLTYTTIVLIPLQDTRSLTRVFFNSYIDVTKKKKNKK